MAREQRYLARDDAELRPPALARLAGILSRGIAWQRVIWRGRHRGREAGTQIGLDDTACGVVKNRQLARVPLAERAFYRGDHLIERTAGDAATRRKGRACVRADMSCRHRSPLATFTRAKFTCQAKAPLD